MSAQVILATRCDAVKRWVALCESGLGSLENFIPLRHAFLYEFPRGESWRPTGTTADSMMMSSHPAQHPWYVCRSKKSKYCTTETQAIFMDRTFGYVGDVVSEHSQMPHEQFKEPLKYSVALCSPCFSFEHFLKFVPRLGSDPSFVVTLKSAYTIGKATVPSRYNGFGGSWVTITFNDGRVVRTCDLWHGGEIPLDMREQLPHNATLEWK